MLSHILDGTNSVRLKKSLQSIPNNTLKDESVAFSLKSYNKCDINDILRRTLYSPYSLLPWVFSDSCQSLKRRKQTGVTSKRSDCSNVSFDHNRSYISLFFCQTID